MTPKLYKMDISPPARAVILCAKAINLDLELIDVDVFKMEQFSQEYLKMNPQHTIPLLDDDGFLLADSHAIMIYLLEKYAKNSPLLPSDIQSKGTLNHRLHFDTGYLFERGVAATRLILREGILKIPEKYMAKLEEAYGIIEKFLSKNDWIASDHMTVADFSYATNLTTWTILLPIQSEKYPKISAWLKKMESLPYFQEVNRPGVEDFIKRIQDAGYSLP